ncbi:MAG: hypothetical protein MJY98_04900 [Fibrobacter sp.]|nr:hypothetical protein [Fibrobacter sp.]
MKMLNFANFKRGARFSKVALLGAAFCMSTLVACSDSSSTDPELTGSTNEPNAVAGDSTLTDTTGHKNPVVSPADLTAEQIAILEKSFDIFKGPKPSYTEDSFGAPVISDDNMWIEPDSQFVYIMEKIIVPFGGWGGGRSQYRYMSEDRLRECFVESDFSGSAVFSIREYQKNPRFLNGFLYEHWKSIESARYTVEEGDTVVIKSVGTGVATSGFWGLDYSCAEFLLNFKDDCKKQNGLFKDFGDGCRKGKPIVSCAFFLPEGATTQSYIDNYEQELIDFCKEDSLWYAPKDDPAHTPGGCMGESGVDENGQSFNRIECTYQNGDPMDLSGWEMDDNYDPEESSIYNAWRLNVKRTYDAYRKQFAVWEIVTDTMIYLKNYPELNSGDGFAYNTLPEGDASKGYRTEGMYPLNDTLVGKFFPEVLNNPRMVEKLTDDENSGTYFMVVLKDVGAKGHVLKSIGQDEILVTDVVKSGDCPADETVYYSAFLVKGNPDWDVSGKTVRRQVFESPLWSCNDPESLERIEPYGQWIVPDMVD